MCKHVPITAHFVIKYAVITAIKAKKIKTEWVARVVFVIRTGNN